MLDSSLNEIYKAIHESIKSRNNSSFHACSLYGLYRAKGGKKSISAVESHPDIHYRILSLSYKLYYSVLLELNSSNSRCKKVQKVDIKHTLRCFFDDDYTKDICKIMKRPYEHCSDIRSHMYGNSLNTTVTLSAKRSNSGVYSLSTSNNATSKTLLSDIAMSHALVFYNSIATLDLSEPSFKPFIVD